MRGSSTFDGKLTGNRQMVDRYNESKGKGGSTEKGGKAGLKSHLSEGPGTLKKSKPKAAGGESGGAHEAGGHDEIKQVVMEHGPSLSHHVHDRKEGAEGGRYHTVTHHEDGYVHHADHDTLEDAHAHAAHAHEDTEHLGDMTKDDYQVEQEKEAEESSPNTGTSRVGYMA